MKMFFLRLLFILTVLFLEFSFFDVLFPWISAPIIILVSVIVWSLLLPFPRAFFMTIPLTLLFDIVSSGKLGLFTLYAVLLVYVTSFISRRLLVEQQSAGGITLYVSLSALSIFGLNIFEFIFSRNNLFLGKENVFILFFSSVSFLNVFLSMIFCVPLFLLAYSSIGRFEKYMQYTAQGEILKMK